MNSIKKVFSLLLVITLFASLITMPSFASTPTVGYSEYLPFNTKPVADSPEKVLYGTKGNDGGRLIVSDKAVAATDYVSGLYGKTSGDYSLILDEVGDGIQDIHVVLDAALRLLKCRRTCADNSTTHKKKTCQKAEWLSEEVL